MDAINELQLLGAIMYLIFGISVMTKGNTASFFEKLGSVQKTVSFPYTVKNRNDTLWQIPLTLKQP